MRIPDPEAPIGSARPLAIVSSMLRPSRVYVRDPAGVSLLRGEAMLIERRTLGGIPLLFKVRMANGVEASVPPTWVHGLPPHLADNVVPFPAGRLATWPRDLYRDAPLAGLEGA